MARCLGGVGKQVPSISSEYVFTMRLTATIVINYYYKMS